LYLTSAATAVIKSNLEMVQQVGTILGNDEDYPVTAQMLQFAITNIKFVLNGGEIE